MMEDEPEGLLPQLVNGVDVDSDPSIVINDLIARTKTLLTELETFRQRLRTLRFEGTVETAHFRNTIQSELGMLERLSAKPRTESTVHVARSSNLPFLEHVWSTAKKSSNLVALQKRVCLHSSARKIPLTHGTQQMDINNRPRREKGSKENAVIVDAIFDGGLTWTKVSLVTNTRLLFDLAKQGWESGGSGDDDDDFIAPADQNDDDRDVPLLKTAKDLVKASKQLRVRTKHPSVQLVLPRVRLGETPEVDKILDECRTVGIDVFCAEDLRPVPSLDDALQNMARDPILSFSHTLNIDCTILLALVSEFSHAKVSKEPWFHAALKRQVEIEGNENLLPALLYPAMGNRKLVCTFEAANRMREIVDTIGTPSEKARTIILMGDDKSKTRQQLVEEMQEWSAYDAPPDWQLPILVVDQNENDCQSRLPDVAKPMSSINQSVFLYGWATGRTTITSNRAVVKQIENDLDKFKDLDESVWPSIWLCPTARSLVGKEKRVALKDAKAEKAMKLPDPLRREHQRRNGLDILSMREGHDVQDLRPNGYPCEEVIAAKNASKTSTEKI